MDLPDPAPAIHYTLLADGSSDRCLIRIIEWVLIQIPSVAARGFSGQFADLTRLREPAHRLQERLTAAVRLYPCDVVFVHRDAERESWEARVQEVEEAAAGFEGGTIVPIVPVRMTEAWLMIDERAIRRAAGNPNGREALNLPSIGQLENLLDPKKLIKELLLAASELSARRRDRLKQNLSERVQRVAVLIEDLQPLRQLAAFSAFEKRTQDVFSKLCQIQPRSSREFH